MTNVGIVGAGIAGLHLGLFLRQHDISATIYTDKTAEQIKSGHLLNSVAHHHLTRHRERELGVNHWDDLHLDYFFHDHYIGGEHPLVFRGDFTQYSYAIDYRIYLPQLLKDFEERGGKVEIGVVQPDNLERLSERHDLLVVAVGRGSYAQLFRRVEELSPFDHPQRRLCVGLYRGIAYSDPVGVTLNVSPMNGELIEIPIYSFAGRVTALLLENVPGGDLEILADLRYEDDPRRFEETVLAKLEKHYPLVYERVDRKEFGLTGSLDLLQGAVTPVIRQPYTQLANGRYVIAVGDAYATVDPVTGQGANVASYSAWQLGEAILEDQVFDERFCQRVARERWNFVTSAAAWSNFTVSPPPPYFINLLVTMAQNKRLADEFTQNFNHPDRQWDNLATAERSQAFINRFS